MRGALGARRHRDHRHRLAAADHHAGARRDASAAATRSEPLFIIDIAVPRDVDAGGRRNRAGVPLQRRRPAVDRPGEPVRRDAEIARAEAIVAEELERFAAWQRSRGAVPTVVALRQRFEEIRRAELQRLDSKLAGLPPEARARVDEVTRLIVEKLLLEPTEQLKALPGRGNAGRLHRGREPAVQPATGESAPSSTDAAADSTPADRTK